MSAIEKHAVERSALNEMLSGGTEDKWWVALTDAIRIIDIRKKAVVHENMDAWIALCHAKFYLTAQLEWPTN